MYILPVNESTPKHELLLQNLRELHRGYTAVHDSFFKFSWKRIWPISLFMPQVDFERAARVAGELARQLGEQQAFTDKTQAKDKNLKNFYRDAGTYAAALKHTCETLQSICAFKHHRLMQDEETHMGDLNSMLKEYQSSTEAHVNAGRDLRNSLHALKDG